MRTSGREGKRGKTGNEREEDLPSVRVAFGWNG